MKVPKVPKIKSNGSDQNPVDRDPRLVFSGSAIRISFFHFPNPFILSFEPALRFQPLNR
jgi:hypothetical protein